MKIDPLNSHMELFQFSDATLQNLNKGMVLVVSPLDCKQILWSIVISDSVKVMNDPPFWDWLAMMMFPNKQMLTNIPKRISPRMIRSQEKYVAIIFSLAPVPLPVILTRWFVFEPIFRAILSPEEYGFSSATFGQSSSYKDVVYRSTFVACCRITEMDGYGAHGHFLIPVQVQEFFGRYGVASSYPSTHTPIILDKHKESQYIKKLILEYV